ncbi:MAG: phage integrase SAM-like domain-containing protein [Tenacibaculum sp.]|nr:phage integrase SAM-like domain-containing protein [Tenacibaculum sp.]
MASIRLVDKTKRDPINLYVRLFYSNKGKRNDIFAKSNILVKKKWWSNKKQNFNSVTDKFPKKELFDKISDLKDFILNEFNTSFSNGETIDTYWLNRQIEIFHNRPKDEQDNYKVYFVPFVKKFIEESKTRINIATGKVLDEKTIRKYNTTLTRIIEFEEYDKCRLLHKDINLSFHKRFVSFLSIEGQYGNSTIEKYISQIKTFCREAESQNIDINKEYKNRKFTFRRQETLDPYLTENEINLIYNLKIEDERLDIIRDMFIIGLRTGLRISDFNDYNRLEIIDNNIKIVEQQKTKKPIVIPIHPQFQKILDKRNGELPRIEINKKSREILFNKNIKVLCKMANINEMILGDKRNPKTNRDERGIYPKYELVSSHICRRSFVSNHYGKLPDETIKAITGHSSDKQFLHYVKIGQKEHVEKMREHWENDKKDGNK